METGKALRVFVVEDDPLVSKMIQGLLQETDYTVVGDAARGRRAIDLVQQLQPDVILMDIRLPDMDGIEVTRRIFEHCPTPVVVLTAYETLDLIKEASAAGVGAYLVKPPNVRELERAITIARARFDDIMKLSRLNADLQARNEELDAFAQTVAHDLKSPLGGMVTRAELLLQDEAGLSDEERRENLEMIARTGRKMNNIIDGLLLLAQLRETEMPVEPLDMAAVVAEAQQRLGHMIEAEAAQIRVPETWPVVLGNGPLVEEVWVNYLSNAIKYGGKPPCLELGATVPKQAGGMVRFWVKDNGAGFASEERSRLFTPFTQLHQARTQGHGLGLSIVRHIVEKLGGQVGVESEVGQGSVFSFTLPHASASPSSADSHR
ncbi:MAG: response regulator [Anaerolineae bacterium]